MHLINSESVPIYTIHVLILTPYGIYTFPPPPPMVLPKVRIEQRFSGIFCFLAPLHPLCTLPVSVQESMCVFVYTYACIKLNFYTWRLYILAVYMYEYGVSGRNKTQGKKEGREFNCLHTMWVAWFVTLSCRSLILNLQVLSFNTSIYSTIENKQIWISPELKKLYLSLTDFCWWHLAQILSKVASVWVHLHY